MKKMLLTALLLGSVGACSAMARNIGRDGRFMAPAHMSDGGGVVREGAEAAPSMARRGLNYLKGGANKVKGYWNNSTRMQKAKAALALISAMAAAGLLKQTYNNWNVGEHSKEVAAYPAWNEWRDGNWKGHASRIAYPYKAGKHVANAVRDSWHQEGYLGRGYDSVAAKAGGLKERFQNWRKGDEGEEG